MAFKDTGDAVHNDIYYTYYTTAIYDGSPSICSFLVCLYDTYNVASSVM